MVNAILSLILFALASYDTWITAKRIKKFGPKVELNKAIRWMATKVDPSFAAATGILIPTLVMIGLSQEAHLQWVLALLVGWRGHIAASQYISQKYLNKFGANPPTPSSVAPASAVEHKAVSPDSFWRN